MKKWLISLITMITLVPLSLQAAPTDYLSGDGDILFHIDLQRLQNSQTYKNLSPMLLNAPPVKKGLERFKAQFGMNPLTDIHAITVEVKPNPTQGKPEILGHITGKFNVAELTQKVEKDAPVKRLQIGQRTVFHSASDNIGLEITDQGIFFGQFERVKAIKKGSFSGNLKAISAGFKPGAQDIWVGAVMNPEMMKNAKDPRLSAFTQVVAFIDLAPGLHINVDALSKDPKIAAMIAGQAQSQIQNMTKAPQMKMFQSLINKIKIKADQNRLTLDVPLDQQNVTQLQMIASMAMMAFQGRAKSAPKPSMPAVTPVPVAPQPGHEGHNH
jgi:hypothetical protein